MNQLYHHGILNQKWGVRNGPPYPLGGGAYSQSERKAIYKERRKKNSIYNKKHFDKVIKKGTDISTLSYDPNRTKGVDMFFATYESLDKHQYNALFNKAVNQTIYDDKGNEIGSAKFLKYRITNKASSDIKVASEDSAAEVFRQLYSKDRDFYNFVTDESRMQGGFVDDKYKFRGYREARTALQNMRDPKHTPTSDELQKAYRMFNYVIPSDGAGDTRMAKDVATQRAKLFKAMTEAGYSAILDTNDSIYGGFKAIAPVIVFDMDKVVLDHVDRTTQSGKRVSEMITAGRKAFGL